MPLRWSRRSEAGNDAVRDSANTMLNFWAVRNSCCLDFATVVNVIAVVISLLS